MDPFHLAWRAGELRAVASTVGELATSLETTGYDVGPGNLPAALDEFGEYLRSNLSEMTDKIDTIADKVNVAVKSYETIEESSESLIKQVADSEAIEPVVDDLQDKARAARYDIGPIHTPNKPLPGRLP